MSTYCRHKENGRKTKARWNAAVSFKQVAVTSVPLEEKSSHVERGGLAPGVLTDRLKRVGMLRFDCFWRSDTGMKKEERNSLDLVTAMSQTSPSSHVKSGINFPARPLRCSANDQAAENRTKVFGSIGYGIQKTSERKGGKKGEAVRVDPILQPKALDQSSFRAQKRFQTTAGPLDTTNVASIKKNLSENQPPSE